MIHMENKMSQNISTFLKDFLAEPGKPITRKRQRCVRSVDLRRLFVLDVLDNCVPLLTQTSSSQQRSTTASGNLITISLSVLTGAFYPM